MAGVRRAWSAASRGQTTSTSARRTCHSFDPPPAIRLARWRAGSGQPDISGQWSCRSPHMSPRLSTPRHPPGPLPLAPGLLPTQKCRRTTNWRGRGRWRCSNPPVRNPPLRQAEPATLRRHPPQNAACAWGKGRFAAWHDASVSPGHRLGIGWIWSGYHISISCVSHW